MISTVSNLNRCLCKRLSRHRYRCSVCRRTYVIFSFPASVKTPNVNESLSQHQPASYIKTKPKIPLDTSLIVDNIAYDALFARTLPLPMLVMFVLFIFIFFFSPRSDGVYVNVNTAGRATRQHTLRLCIYSRTDTHRNVVQKTT